MDIELNLIKRLTRAQRRAVDLAAHRYAAFHRLPAVVKWGIHGADTVGRMQRG
jgi:hypothetical protein